MAVSINVSDKVLAGLNQSYTITSDSGEPSGQVAVGGRARSPDHPPWPAEGDGFIRAA